MLIDCLSCCLLNFMAGYLLATNSEFFYYLSLPFLIANLCIYGLLITEN